MAVTVDEPAEGVRSLERGLALLRSMNEDPGASVTKLSRRLNLPRSTLYRLLATLERMGYVGRTVGVSGYRLTHSVHNLSEGYRDDDWIEAAWPELVAAGEHIVWPLSLFTFDVNSMVIRLTTHDRSTLSIDYAMTGRRMAMPSTAAGTAYLAFCPDEEREWLLAQPQYAGELATFTMREVLERRLQETVRQGYATRVGGVMPKTSSLSVPILTNSRVIGCVSVIWIRSALRHEQAIAKLADPVKALAARIADLALAPG